jgi:hypothetical protein
MALGVDAGAAQAASVRGQLGSPGSRACGPVVARLGHAQRRAGTEDDRRLVLAGGRWGGLFAGVDGTASPEDMPPAAGRSARRPVSLRCKPTRGRANGRITAGYQGGPRLILAQMGVVAPSLRPPKAGARVTTDRRDAMPLARRARAGARPAGAVPPVADAARRDRPRGRAEPRSALQAAQGRLTACVRSQDRRDPGRATGSPAHLRGLAAVGGPPRRTTVSCQHRSGRCTHRPHASSGSHRHGKRTGPPGVCPRWAQPCRLCGACQALGPSPGGPPWATAPVSRAQAHGGHAGAWSLPPLPRGSGARRGPGPQPGIPRPARRWSQAPGRPALPPRAGALAHGDAPNPPRCARTSAGTPTAGGANAPDTWGPEATRHTSSPSPWPVRARDAWGPWPHRGQAPRQAPGPLAPAPATPQGADVPQKRRRPGVGSPAAACRGVARSRGPRARQAPDGGQEGGSQPPASRRSNRRLFRAPPLPMYGGQKTSR